MQNQDLRKVMVSEIEGPAHYLQKFSHEFRKFWRFGESPKERYTLPDQGQTAISLSPRINDFIDSIKPIRQIIVHKFFIREEIYAKSFRRIIMHNIHYDPTKAIFSHVVWRLRFPAQRWKLALNQIQPCRRGKRRLYLPHWPHRNAPPTSGYHPMTTWRILNHSIASGRLDSAAITSRWHRRDEDELRHCQVQKKVS